MLDPISLAGLSLQVAHSLSPVIKALAQAYRNGKTVHQTLHGLHSDLIAITKLNENISRLFSSSSFVTAIQDFQSDCDITLVESLERGLHSCLREAQKLRDVLDGLGLQAHTYRIARGYQQWRLDRRLDDIDRFKRNFIDCKSSIQLAFQVLTTCKQMYTAERDARHVVELKCQIGELQNAIQEISRQITLRQLIPIDGEQTELLDEMKNIQTTSENLERQATLRLDYLTSLVEDTRILTCPARSTALTMPLDGNALGMRSFSPGTGMNQYGSPRSVDSSYGTLETANSVPRDSVGPKGVKIDVESSVPDSSPQRTVATLRTLSRTTTWPPKNTLSSDVSITAQEFEERICALLDSAGTESMGTFKPFSNECIVFVANLLTAVGKRTWSERPRTYLVLRLIDEVKLMDIFVFEGLKDIDFPYTDSNLPFCLSSTDVRQNFLHQQRHVLSPRDADLLRGDRHHHLEKSADSYFTVGARLGSGGFSLVDKVQSRLTLLEYARKRIDRSTTFAKDRKALSFLENEVHNLKRLSHHHLVEFVSSYTDNNYIGIIMQPVADVDLYRHLAKRDWTSHDLVTLRSFTGCLCSALAYLHQNRCRHKDLKPQNILIKGENVLISDFGTAFDWTELDSEVTIGPPDACTKLYIAPEVGLHQPRDTSSDIWSLGCILLEMATLLSGKSLQDKSDFFRSFGNLSAAYWTNHEALNRWISIVRQASGDTDLSLLRWIKAMTSKDPSSRPRAEELVSQVSIACNGDVRYGRSCCFNIYGADHTSWEGSAAENENLETAKNVDITKATSTSTMPLPCPPLMKHAPPEVDLNHINEAASEPFQPSHTAMQPMEHEHKRRRLIKDQVDSDLSTRTNSTFDPSHNTNEVLPLQVSLSTTEPKWGLRNGVTEEMFTTRTTEDAFFGSHQKFENHLIELRGRNPNWHSHLCGLIEKPSYDSKGFNILIVASKFNNNALARDVVEMAVRKKPELVNEVNMYKNSAIHYAALKGQAKMIDYLIKNGAQPNIQNLRGLTALHIALRHKRKDAVKKLLQYLSPDQVNVGDDSGQTSAHYAFDAEELTRQLILAGADINSKDRWGLISSQYRESSNVDAAKMPMSQILQRSPTLETSTISSIKQRYRLIKEKSVDDCFCAMCLMSIAVRKACDNFAGATPFCYCPNHIRVYAQDTISSEATIDLDLRYCRCLGCASGREYNKKHPPCGTPINNDYSPCNGLDAPATIRQHLSVDQAMTPRAMFTGDLLLPYPGHRYYDQLINEDIAKNVTDLPEQHLRAAALKSLADAGFRGWKSYRKNPSRALNWVVSKSGHLAHVCKIVEILLDCGGDVDTWEEYSSEGTLLSVAARNQDLAFMKLLLDRHARVNRGVFVDTRNCNFWPLKSAMLHDRPLSARMLLRAGASVNFQDPLSKSTLLHTASAGWRIPLLLAHGAFTEIKDGDGNTPLHLAVANNDLPATMTLLDSGANIEATGKDSARPLSIALRTGDSRLVLTLLGYGADVRVPCNGMPCALFYAIKECRADVVRMLLAEYWSEEDTHQKDGSGRGFLHVLAASQIRDSTLIDEIIEYGNDVDAEDFSGSTPLHEAAAKGHSVMVLRLLAKGATAHLQNHEGKTALDLARSKRHCEVVECLGGTYKYRKSWWRV